VSPTGLTVAVNPQGLGVGTYTGTITVSSPNAAAQAINVSYVVSSLPTPVLAVVENGASFQPGPVAPGEIITITGTNIGPANPVISPSTPGATMPTQVLGTQVTFDGIPAPLLYVSSTQVNAIVPYAIAGRTQTQLVVIANNASTSGIALSVTSSAPALFLNTAAGLPASQGAILNQNGTVNTPNNPAPRASVIVLFATGEGATSPAGVDGYVIPLDVNALKHPVLPVQVTIGGYPADIQYVGSAPGLVSGAVQINAVVPEGTGSGPTIPVVVTVGSNSSPNVATVAIQ
jgi:uncharacterized protein (TIGR03437 family)